MNTEFLQLGSHRLTVNTQPFELTWVLDHGKAALSLTGTDYTEVLTEVTWDTSPESELPLTAIESPTVYRGEYLAALVWPMLPAGVLAPPEFTTNSPLWPIITLMPLTLRKVWRHLSKLISYLPIPRTSDTNQGVSSVALPSPIPNASNLLEQVHHYLATHPAETGYEYGIHDIDAVTILEKLWYFEAHASRLRFGPLPRAVAQLFWVFSADPAARKLWENTIRGLSQLSSLVGTAGTTCLQQLGTGLQQAIHCLVAEPSLIPLQHLSTIDKTWVAQRAGEYLLEELQDAPLTFTMSTAAKQLVDGFWQDLEERDKRLEFEAELKTLTAAWSSQWLLIHTALTNYVNNAMPFDSTINYYLPEAIVIILTTSGWLHQLNSTNLQVNLSVLGQHPRIKNHILSLQLDEFSERLQYLITVTVPTQKSARDLRTQLLEAAQQRLQLTQYQPTPSPSWVTHRWLTQVLFNRLGDNLAQQLEQGNHGALLLLAPSGFGKTSLVEFLAFRLGVLLVRIDGTALSTTVTSLDPAAAPHALARLELEKLNFALTLGNNVILLLDNCHYCPTEWWQLLIPLVAPSRRIQGVWQGQTRHYDLRGKRFALILAGTHTVAFPPSLINRLDICLMALVVPEHEEWFRLSYVETAIPRQPLLAPLIGRENDLDELLRLVRAKDLSPEALATVTAKYPAEELSDIINLLKQLWQVQTIVFKIHQHYLTSLIQTDRWRTQPPFQLLGNYQTMNKLADKLTATMTEVEVEQLVMEHYFEQAHALPSGNEENWLQCLALMDKLSPAQATRWQLIQHAFTATVISDDPTLDPVSRLVKQLQGLGEQLQYIQTTLAHPEASSPLPKLVEALANSQLAVTVVNQLPTNLEESLRILLDMVDKTLLPIVQDYERKSKLDLIIFERIKEMSEILKDLPKDSSGKVQKTYKPLSFKD